MSGELENVVKRGSGGEEQEWRGYVAEDRRVFGITGDWSTAALDPGVWYSTECAATGVTIASLRRFRAALI